MKRITKEREARGWSRAELARRASLNPATVGQVEAGRFVPYFAQLDKIAQALGWSQDPATLLDEVRGDGQIA